MTQIVPMTLKQLADHYGIDKRTMHRWIDIAKDELGFSSPHGRLFTPKQVEKIFDVIGSPKLYKDDE